MFRHRWYESCFEEGEKERERKREGKKVEKEGERRKGWRMEGLIVGAINYYPLCPSPEAILVHMG